MSVRELKNCNRNLLSRHRNPVKSGDNMNQIGTGGEDHLNGRNRILIAPVGIMYF